MHNDGRGVIGILKDAELKDLDVPLDSYIMQAASDDLDIEFPRKKERNNKNKDKYSSSISVPWSRLKKGQYKDIQSNLEKKAKEKNTTGAEWECNAWIAQATLERIKEEKKEYNKNDNSEKKYDQSNRLYSTNIENSDKN